MTFGNETGFVAYTASPKVQATKNFVTKRSDWFIKKKFQWRNSFVTKCILFYFSDKLFRHQILFMIINQFNSDETFCHLLFGICTGSVWVRFVLLKLSTKWVNFLFDCCMFTIGLWWRKFSYEYFSICFLLCFCIKMCFFNDEKLRQIMNYHNLVYYNFSLF